MITYIFELSLIGLLIVYIVLDKKYRTKEINLLIMILCFLSILSIIYTVYKLYMFKYYFDVFIKREIFFNNCIDLSISLIIILTIALIVAMFCIVKRKKEDNLDIATDLNKRISFIMVLIALLFLVVYTICTDDLKFDESKLDQNIIGENYNGKHQTDYTTEQMVSITDKLNEIERNYSSKEVIRSINDLKSSSYVNYLFFEDEVPAYSSADKLKIIIKYLVPTFDYKAGEMLQKKPHQYYPESGVYDLFAVEHYYIEDKSFYKLKTIFLLGVAGRNKSDEWVYNEDVVYIYQSRNLVTLNILPIKSCYKASEFLFIEEFKDAN